jgi:hypothetical protein
MQPSDLAEFTALLDGTCALLSRGSYQPNAASTALFFRAMQAYPLHVVRKGLEAHMADPQRGRFVPVPADVIAQIEGAAAQDGRPDAEEAWAIAVRAADEAETVVWTTEIAQAWGVCQPVFALGDEVGARMAFKSAYARLTSEARNVREPVSWSPTIGHDESRRADALTRAVECGRLPAAYLPAPMGPVAGLLELSAVRGIPANVKSRLLEIRQQITPRPDDVPGEDFLAKQRTVELKAEAARRADGREAA